MATHGRLPKARKSVDAADRCCPIGVWAWWFYPRCTHGQTGNCRSQCAPTVPGGSRNPCNHPILDESAVCRAAGSLLRSQVRPCPAQRCGFASWSVGILAARSRACTERGARSCRAGGERRVRPSATVGVCRRAAASPKGQLARLDWRRVQPHQDVNRMGDQLVADRGFGQAPA